MNNFKMFHKNDPGEENSYRNSVALSENDNTLNHPERNSDTQTSTTNLFSDSNNLSTISRRKSSTSYDSITIPTPPKTFSFSRWIQKCQVPSALFDVIMSLLIPLLIWLATFVTVGSENLPGGSVFVIVFLEFVGRIMGYLVSLVHLPPMVGMLGLGLIIRNVPYVDFGKYLAPSVSAPIRQISLAVILTRAGLGLNLDVLLKFKWLVARLAFFPTFFEAVSTALLVRLLIGFPWLWCLLVGFVVAAVSPAVIVPRLLAFQEQGYGVEKGIPTIILASASLDNIVAIALFGVVIGFTFSNKSLALTILQGPIEIIMGCAAGVIWGFFAGMIFPPSSKQNDFDKSVLKILVVLGGGISCVLGFQRLGYSGAGVLGCLISSFTAACLWRKRQAAIYDFETIRWIFTFLWKFFEPLLFGVIGCQIEISKLDTNVLVLGLGCLAVGAVVRFITTFLMVSRTGLNLKEKLFFGISWIPKATVQAAIGPMALDLARTSGREEDKELGLQVMTFAVLVIILTAPLGELLVILSGPRFLNKQNSEKVVAVTDNICEGPEP